MEAIHAILGNLGIVDFALFGVLILFALLLTGTRSREISNLMEIYNKFESRDLFVEDMIASIRKHSSRSAFLLLFAALCTAGLSVYHAQKSAPTGPTAEQTAELETLRQELATARTALTGLEQQLATANDADPAQLSATKEAFEKAFISHFYLEKCGKATLYDAMTIYTILTQTLAQQGAPAAMATTVLNSARGTYQELYASGACDNQTVAPMLQNQRQYIDAALQNIQATWLQSATPQATAPTKAAQPVVLQEATPTPPSNNPPTGQPISLTPEEEAAVKATLQATPEQPAPLPGQPE